MDIKLSQRTEMALAVLREHLNASDTEIIEEAIAHLFAEYQAAGKIPELDVPTAPRSLMEVMAMITGY